MIRLLGGIDRKEFQVLIINVVLDLLIRLPGYFRYCAHMMAPFSQREWRFSDVQHSLCCRSVKTMDTDIEKVDCEKSRP